MSKYYIKGHWYTDLGKRIALNDLLVEVQHCLVAYKQFHDQFSTKKEKKEKRRKTPS